MDNLVVVAVVVSVVGMFLLFVALVFLYGMMYLLTSVVKDRSPASATAVSAAAPRPAPVLALDKDAAGRVAVLRAAAVAVALARAEGDGRPPGMTVGRGLAEGGPASPWWALHHGRQLVNRPSSRRSR